MARGIDECDDVRGGFEEVAEEADAGGGVGGEEVEDLRDFDDGAEGDDAEAEGFGDSEGEAGAVEVELED